MRRNTRAVLAALPLVVAASGGVGLVSRTDVTDPYIRASVGNQPVREFGNGRGHRTAFYDINLRYLSIQGYKFLDKTTEEILYIELKQPQEGASRVLPSAGSGAWAAYTLHDVVSDSVLSFGTDAIHKGVIRLTCFDPRLRIVEGTFSFEGMGRSRMMRLRQGTFRLPVTVVSPDYSGMKD